MYPIILNSFISDPVDHIILVLEFIPRAHFLLLEKVVLLKLQIMQQTAKTASWCYQFPECHISSILFAVRQGLQEVACSKVSPLALFSPTWATQLQGAELGTEASLPS